MSISVRLAAAGLVIIAGFAPVCAQMLPPEPPAPMSPATTLPSYRSLPLPPPEAPAPMPLASTLPSMRGDNALGAEPPVIMPPASTLPSFRPPDPAGR
ncbi:MAG: hypothetical protein ACJ8AW_16825 [Rhodopila sp.]